MFHGRPYGTGAAAGGAGEELSKCITIKVFGCSLGGGFIPSFFSLFKESFSRNLNSLVFAKTLSISDQVRCWIVTYKASFWNYEARPQILQEFLAFPLSLTPSTPHPPYMKLEVRAWIQVLCMHIYVRVYVCT